MAGLKNDAQIDARVQAAKAQMMSRLKLKMANGGWSGKAEFVLTFTSSRKASDAEFKIGAESLKPASKALTAMQYPPASANAMVLVVFVAFLVAMMMRVVDVRKELVK